MDNVRIRDLYTGKPDAKDEINFEGLDEFIRTFVVADHFQIESLINDSNCFITGFKGTGKTALLFYLDNLIQDADCAACTSYIFFREDFNEMKRNHLNAFSARMLSSISVEDNALLGVSDFSYIWRWLFFKRIVSDNAEYNRNLFKDDEHWLAFERTINQIKDPLNPRKSTIPNKIRLSAQYKDPTNMSEITPEIEVDFQSQGSSSYVTFITLLESADKLFSELSRTDIPYYIFVDELEAHFGERAVFERDLSLIRDLLFTVRRYNSMFVKMGMKKTKIICSVRNEMLNAITRFTVTKELNKAISGFSVPLNWSYTNTSSYAHPIIQILLKRIAVCEGTDVSSLKDIYTRWFPEKIHDIEPANYILNNSWCKPRDMVRLLSTAKNCIQNGNTVFTQSVFSSLNKAYSEESLAEIREELRALYAPQELDTIINCFMGYKTVFSVKQLKQRVSDYFSQTVMATHFNQIIEDLYRLGFLGNFMPISKTYRWQHKGDDRVILTDEWRLCVHYALHGALSIGSRLNFGMTRGQPPETGDVVTATVTNVIKSFALVEFTHLGETYSGRIHIKEFKKLGHGYIKCLNHIVKEGDKFRTAVTDFDPKHDRWKLLLLVEDINKISDKCIGDTP